MIGIGLSISPKINIMSKFKESYMIVKVLKPKHGKPQHVFLIDSGGELLEFYNKEEAQSTADLFEINSDKGFKYFVKPIIKTVN